MKVKGTVSHLAIISRLAALESQAGCGEVLVVRRQDPIEFSEKVALLIVPCTKLIKVSIVEDPTKDKCTYITDQLSLMGS